ncbi:MAG: hypothetical protein QF486_04130 [Candidatus Woesearchaeota archaeon]|jgi:hypothetical protein|nr:hypothetical protein [Candidatus Woesearchaeota archaeon]MDP7181692.1 hypothetical protein [Candidatus Woesearchaeota archaeon]MDP7198781.1 hypothetical protein [Candidatus Woesearchaeota archaeon]MDP7467219.1 hypothetical protein [Candidatus Woesearchaeota archaeon]MDP7647446.1 hypothetical protein [Candidatus Woesearchaeota archaeon]
MENYESPGTIDITTGRRVDVEEMRARAPIFKADSCGMPDLNKGNRVAYTGNIVTDTSASDCTPDSDREQDP